MANTMHACSTTSSDRSLSISFMNSSSIKSIDFSLFFPFYFLRKLLTYNSLLDPFVMRIHQFTAQILCHLGSFNVSEQIIQCCTHNQSKFEFFFEKFWANFGNCFLKESSWSNNVNNMNDSRKECLEISKQMNDQIVNINAHKKQTDIFIRTALTAVHRSFRRSMIRLNPKSASCKLEKDKKTEWKLCSFIKTRKKSNLRWDWTQISY